MSGPEDSIPYEELELEDPSNVMTYYERSSFKFEVVTNPPLNDREVEDMSRRLRFSKSLTAFGLDLYQGAAGQVPGNMCLPTFSVATMLVSFLPCLKPEWKTLLQQVLHLEEEGPSNYNYYFGDYYKKCIHNMVAVLKLEFTLVDGCLIAMERQHPYTFFFIDATLSPSPIRPQVADIKRDPEECRKRINSDVEALTMGHIQDIVPESGISDTTNIVMAAGVHFETSLRLECERAVVEERTFHVRKGVDKKCQMLRFRGHFEATFSQDLQCKVVHFPLKFPHHTMVVLLPTEGLAELEKKLTAQSLQDAISSLSHSNMDVTLPCFSVTTDLPLLVPLKNLGLGDFFTPSRVEYDIAMEKMDLHFDDFFHKTSFRLDSNFMADCSLHKDFVADTRLEINQPFLFLVRFERMDASLTLFMGRVTDPS